MSTEMQTKVQASPAQNFTPVQTGLLQRKSALCNTPGLVEDSKQDKEKLTLQHSSADQAGTTTVPPIVHEVLGSPGQPVDAATRAFMEPRFGHDFSKVRVHTDARAAESAREVNALAYTVGHDIVFGEGEYAPETSTGQRILTHELTHVVQQRHVRSVFQSLSLDKQDCNSLEREADEIGRSVASGQFAKVVGAVVSPVIQRFLTTEPAGGCGICYGSPALVGIQAHRVIQQEFENMHPLGLVEFPFSSPGDENGRLDLAIATPTGFEIGEIKPGNPQGFEDGIRDLAFYTLAIEAAFSPVNPNLTVEFLTLPIPPTIMPDPVAFTAGCPPQMIYVVPMLPGLYGYFCEPPFSQVRSQCSCRPLIPPPVRQPQEAEEHEEALRRAREQRCVIEPLVPVAVTAAVMASLLRLLGRRAAGGPAYAVAALIATLALLPSGRVEAGISLEGRDPIEALFESMAQQGVPPPPELQRIIKSDPELRRIVEQAVRTGNVSEAQLELNRRIVELVEANINQFSRDELEMLLTAAESARGTLPRGDVTVDRLRQTLAQARARGAGGATGGPSQPGTRAPETAEPETAAPIPERALEAVSGAPEAHISPELRSRLSESPAPVIRLYAAITLQTGEGEGVTSETLQRFFEAADIEPPLTDTEVDQLIESTVPISNQTGNEILESLERAIERVVRARVPRATAEQGPSPSQPTTLAPPQVITPSTSPQQAPELRRGEVTERGRRIGRRLSHIHSLDIGKSRIEYQGNLRRNHSITGFFAARAQDRILVGGYVRLTPLRSLGRGRWRIRIEPGWQRFNERGQFLNIIQGTILAELTPIRQAETRE